MDKTLYEYPLHCAMWLESINKKEDSRHCKQCHNGWSVDAFLEDHGPYFRRALNGMYNGNNLVVCCEVAKICTK